MWILAPFISSLYPLHSAFQLGTWRRLALEVRIEELRSQSQTPSPSLGDLAAICGELLKLLGKILLIYRFPRLTWEQPNLVNRGAGWELLNLKPPQVILMISQGCEITALGNW